MASKEYSRRLYVRMMIVSILLSIAKASPDKAGHCQFSKDGTDIIVKVIINRSHFDKVDVKSFSIFKGKGTSQDRMVFYQKPSLVPKCAYNYGNASWCNAGILPSTTTTEKSIEMNMNLTASPFAESLPLTIKLDADGQGNFDSTIPFICSIPVNLNHTAVEDNIKRNITPTPNSATMSGHQQSLSTSRNAITKSSVSVTTTGFTKLPSLESTFSGKQALLKKIFIPIGVILVVTAGVCVFIYKVYKKWKLSSNLPEKPYKLSDVEQST